MRCGPARAGPGCLDLRPPNRALSSGQVLRVTSSTGLPTHGVIRADRQFQTVFALAGKEPSSAYAGPWLTSKKFTRKNLI
jgi:hypothetical protein